jgi:hypothetical protein
VNGHMYLIRHGDNLNLKFYLLKFHIKHGLIFFVRSFVST